MNARRFAAAAAIVAVVGGCQTTTPTASPATAPSGAPSANATLPAAAACSDEIVWPPHEDLAGIRAEIETKAIALGELYSIGDGGGIVMVSLAARSECLARSIADAYGANVRLTVGLLPFPLEDDADRACAATPWPMGSIPGLTAVLAFQESQVPQGDGLKATVHFANISPGNINVLTSSSFPVYIFVEDADKPVGAPDGVVAGTGLSFTLTPGGSRDVGGYGGTASCSPALGYVLPIGSYRARALVDFSPPQGGDVHVFWTNPAPIEVVARAAS